MGECLEDLDSILLNEVQKNATADKLLKKIHRRFKEDYVEGEEDCSCCFTVRSVNFYFLHTL